MLLPSVFSRCRTALRLSSESRTQRYHLVYRVRTPALGAGEWAVVCPVPPTVGYQEITNVTFDPPGPNIARDQRWGNMYAVWTVPPEGGELRCGFSAQVTVHPRRGMSHPYGNSVAVSPIMPDSYVALADDVRMISQRISAPADSVPQYVRRCYHYVVRVLRYGNPILELYSVRDALRLEAVDCGGFSTMVAALLLARSIPARLNVGFLSGASGGMHAWLEARLSGGAWLPLDPSLDNLRRAGRTQRSGGYGYVGSDHVVCSFGSDVPIEISSGRYRVALLQHAVSLGPKHPPQYHPAEVQLRRV